MCAIASRSRTGRAVVGRTAAARAAVVRRACVAVGRAVIIVVVVVNIIIVRESTDRSVDDRIRNRIRGCRGRVGRSVSIARSIDGGDRWMWTLNDARDRSGVA